MIVIIGVIFIHFNNIQLSRGITWSAPSIEIDEGRYSGGASIRALNIEKKLDF